MQTVLIRLGSAQAKLDAHNPRVLIGRDPSCGLSAADGGLSRRHAEVYVESGLTYIRDLGSSNGTWVNGQPVSGQATPLSPGQQVYLGTSPLGVEWQGGPGGGATMMVAMPPELKALIEQRKAQAQAMAQPAPAMAAPAAPAGLGVGGKAAPLPAEFAYRRQGSNNNGALLIALRGDTFANNQMLDGFLEFTAMDNETVASIIVELVEFHRKGPKDGHVWDRMLVRQGPWRAQKGDVLPLPFQLRIPPGTSISGRDVFWEIRSYVDINWALDIDAKSPINMRNTDIERIRDALGALDYRIVDIESESMGQRFTGKFHPPAQLKSQLGISDINLWVEYLGANLKVTMEVEKTSLFKFDKRNETVFDLARFRAAPLTEVSGNFMQQINAMMAK